MQAEQKNFEDLATAHRRREARAERAHRRALRRAERCGAYWRELLIDLALSAVIAGAFVALFLFAANHS